MSAMGEGAGGGVLLDAVEPVKASTPCWPTALMGRLCDECSRVWCEPPASQVAMAKEGPRFGVTGSRRARPRTSSAGTGRVLGKGRQAWAAACADLCWGCAGVKLATNREPMTLAAPPSEPKGRHAACSPPPTQGLTVAPPCRPKSLSSAPEYARLLQDEADWGHRPAAEELPVVSEALCSQAGPKAGKEAEAEAAARAARVRQLKARHSSAQRAEDIVP